MPASYVHQSVADAALRRTGSVPDSCLHAAYLAGCEGPDPFFYGLSPAAGTMMHRRHTGTFLITLVSNAASPAENCYARGFLTHYAADTVFHPFVYGHSLTADGAYSANLHGIIEHAYEIVRFRRDGNATGIPVQLAGLEQMTPEYRNTCIHLLAGSMREVYDEHLPTEPALQRIFSTSVKVARLLRSSGGHKYRLLGALRGPFRLDQTAHAHMIPPEPPAGDLWNGSHESWTSIFEPDRVRYESMDDLYHMAVTRATALLAAADAFTSGHLTASAFEDVIGGLSYDSGLPWQETPPPDRAPGCHPKR